MRTSAKWALLGVGLLVVSALAVATILVFVIAGRRIPSRSVLVVRATGAILDADERPPIEQVLGAEIETLPQTVQAIARAAKDDRIRAIRLEVGDIQAGWAVTQELRAAIGEFQSTGKPVYAYIASGGTQEYYLASVADKVYMLPGGMLLATGLLADAPFFLGTLDKLKITPDFERIGQYKSAAEQWTRDSMSDSQRRATEAILDSLYGQIVGDIAASRKIPEDDVRRAIDAGLLTPSEAVEQHLVDALLYPDQVRSEVSQVAGTDREVRVRAYRSAKGWWSHLGKRIAIVHANGTIVSGKSGSGAFGGQFVGSESLAKILEDVRDDDGIHAVILRIDSPGGSGVASDAIWRETQLLKQEKPLIVSMGDVAASGGYYIAMGADAIVADPGTITGSIGVFTGKFNMRGFYEEWLGLHREQIKRGANADLMSDYSSFSESQRVRLHAQLEDFYQGFVHKAAKGRGKKDEEIDKVAQGRVWTGAQAKEIGLVDELGGIAKAIEVAREKAGIGPDEAITVETYPRKKGFFELFTESDDDETKSKIPIPGTLGRMLAAMETQERVAADGPAFWFAGWTLHP